MSSSVPVDDAGSDTGTVEGTHATRDAALEAVEAQHARFGGIKWGAAFFGWLSANGLAVLLLAILSAGGVAFGLFQVPDAGRATGGATAQADTTGISGGIALLVALFLAYLAGGYVAGRMSRFDGGRQGLAVWLTGLVVVALFALAGALLGARFNVLSELELPSIPISGTTATTAGVIAGVAALFATLLGAVIGGKLGTHYHRRVDRAGFVL